MNARRYATARTSRADRRYEGLPKVDTPQQAIERISNIFHSRDPMEQVKDAVVADTEHMVEVVRIVEKDYDRFTHSGDVLMAVATYSPNATARRRAVKVLAAHNERGNLTYVRNYSEFDDTKRAARRFVGSLGES